MKQTKKKINTSFPLRPMAGYILIEPQEAVNKTASGIYLPDSNTEKPVEGKVLACGGSVFEDGCEVASPVKVGEIVLYKKWGGNEVKFNGKEYLFAKFEDILAVREK
jgi:chaperonin GroES